MIVHYDIYSTSDGEWRVESMSGCNPSGYTVKCIHTTCPQCSPFKDDFRICKEPQCFFCARTCIFGTASAMTTLMIMCVNIFIGKINIFSEQNVCSNL